MTSEAVSLRCGRPWLVAESRIAGVIAIAAAFGVLATACVGSREVERIVPVRVSHLTHLGDPARRASLRLVVAGLDADTAGESERALASYRRAMQVDATNPYAYVALARHWVEAGKPDQALAFLDQAEVLMQWSDENSLGARVHLIGLRGQAATMGDSPKHAAALLRQAADLSPEIWGDGVLMADELR